MSSAAVSDSQMQVEGTCATVNVRVKFCKDTHELDVDTNGSLDDFKAQVFSVTSVAPERQKLVFKGKQLKVNGDLQGLKAGTLIQLIASAVDLVTAPSKPVMFEEDMTDTQKAVLHKELPSGLENLGNTCYLNSTVQALRSIPELKQALISYSKSRAPGHNSNPNHIISSTLGGLLDSLEHSTRPQPPLLFVQSFRTTFPNFAERNERGIWKQQDADECYTQLASCIKQSLANAPIPTVPREKITVDKLFEGEFETKTHCMESADEPDKVETEKFLRLQCHIDIKTNHLIDGLSNDLKSEVSKHSPTLGRDAVFSITKRITRLPPFLVVQFVRFFWKAKEQIKTKVNRKVIFPLRLDVTELCCEALQKTFHERRKAYLVEYEQQLKIKNRSIDETLKKEQEWKKLTNRERYLLQEKQRKEQKEAASSSSSSTSSSSLPPPAAAAVSALSLSDSSSSSLSPSLSSSSSSLPPAAALSPLSASSSSTISFSSSSSVPPSAAAASSASSSSSSLPPPPALAAGAPVISSSSSSDLPSSSPLPPAAAVSSSASSEFFERKAALDQRRAAEQKAAASEMLIDADSGKAATGPTGIGALDLTIGMYELTAVVTHTGLSADGGHYMAYCRKDDASTKWLKFDDEKVTETDAEDVKSLAGGAQTPIAYLLFYRLVVK